MSFKVTTVITDIFPVKENNKEEISLKSNIKYISANQVTPDMLNTITGIDSKYCYIGRINEITGEVSNPTIKVIGDKFIHL